MDTERTLVLIRHAKSDWTGNEADIDRPLAKRGRRQAPESGRWLADNVGIDLAVVSPANRAHSTWDLIATQFDEPPPSRIDHRMYDASEDDLLGVAHDLSIDLRGVALVGHNPGMEDLATLLAGQWLRMPTSAVAVFIFTGPWSGIGPDTTRLRAAGRPPGPDR